MFDYVGLFSAALNVQSAGQKNSPVYQDMDKKLAVQFDKAPKLYCQNHRLSLLPGQERLQTAWSGQRKGRPGGQQQGYSSLHHFTGESPFLP